MSSVRVTNIAHPSASGNNIVLDSGGGATFSQITGGAISSGTSVASTSGTSIDFTGIPAWVKRITVMFNGVSLNSTANVRIRVGRSSGATIVTSGYTGVVYSNVTGPESAYSAGFDLVPSSFGNASNAFTGIAVLSLLTGTTWAFSSNVAEVVANNKVSLAAGKIDAGGTLDTIRITSTSGTDTFDAGTINILYEG